ncbi:MAG: hypothetical protein EOR65_14450, partial [Mesorhizobium sp.]
MRNSRAFAQHYGTRRLPSARGTPLCPAGHLPRKGGDWLWQRRLSLCNVGGLRNRRRHLISPLAGEMAG